MKKRYLIIFIVITIIVEVFFTIKYIGEAEYYKNDNVKINELIKKVEESYGEFTRFSDLYEYTVLDADGKILYKTQENISDSLNEAYKNKDTIVDYSYDTNKTGKIIIHNDFEEIMNIQIQRYIKVIAFISFTQIFIFVIYYIYLYKSILKPFEKMNSFATRVTDGNLDIPLEMDKQNNFGAFTEAFDIMRYEIKKSREAEKNAIEAKKELVARIKS